MDFRSGGSEKHKMLKCSNIDLYIHLIAVEGLKPLIEVSHVSRRQTCFVLVFTITSKTIVSFIHNFRHISPKPTE